MTKLPHIKLDQAFYHRQFKCTSDQCVFGFGLSPNLAYYDWSVKDKRRVRMPRRGIWNKQSCRQRFPWYANYEKGTNMLVWYGGVLRQIYDYDYNTDELILRG